MCCGEIAAAHAWAAELSPLPTCVGCGVFAAAHFLRQSSGSHAFLEFRFRGVLTDGPRCLVFWEFLTLFLNNILTLRSIPMSEVGEAQWFLVLDRIVMVIFMLDVCANFVTGATARATKLLWTARPHPLCIVETRMSKFSLSWQDFTWR